MVEGIYRVIGLEREKERQQAFFKQAYAKRFTLYAAIDAKCAQGLIQDTFNFTQAQARYDRQLTLVEAACTMSHQAVWRELASHPTATYAVICEDDAFFSSDMAVLEALLPEFFGSTKKKDIGILIFGESNTHSFNGVLKYKLGFPMQWNPLTKKGLSNTVYKIGRLSTNYLCGTVGYVISKDWAKVLCDIEPSWLADDFQVIKEAGEAKCHRTLDVFHIRPRLVIENAVCKSGLELERRQEQIKGWGPRKHSWGSVIYIAMKSISLYWWRRYTSSK